MYQIGWNAARAFVFVLGHGSFSEYLISLWRYRITEGQGQCDMKSITNVRFEDCKQKTVITKGTLKSKKLVVSLPTAPIPYHTVPPSTVHHSSISTMSSISTISIHYPLRTIHTSVDVFGLRMALDRAEMSERYASDEHVLQ